MNYNFIAAKGPRRVAFIKAYTGGCLASIPFYPHYIQARYSVDGSYTRAYLKLKKERKTTNEKNDAQ